MKWLVENNGLTHQKYAAIIQHGDAVLKKARLKKSQEFDGPFADAEDWRLLIDGVEYAKKDYYAKDQPRKSPKRRHRNDRA